MEKINIAELLKLCPKGMELDCTIFNGKVCFEGFDHNNSAYPIKISVNLVNIEHLDIYGQYNARDYAKCIIFPKGKTTWEGFQRPFKDGDIVFYNDTIAIFKEWGDETLFRTYVTKYLCCDFFIDTHVPLFGKSVRKEIRFATEEEKEKLFRAIKANGYKWNAETKTLEKLVESRFFKVGDRIKHKDSGIYCTLGEYSEDISAYRTNIGLSITHKDLEQWELATNKFYITTLKPFNKVLVRDSNAQKWIISFFSHYDNNQGKYKYFCINNTMFAQCIPYENNEYLRGTTENCDDFYKNWK